MVLRSSRDRSILPSTPNFLQITNFPPSPNLNQPPLPNKPMTSTAAPSSTSPSPNFLPILLPTLFTNPLHTNLSPTFSTKQLFPPNPFTKPLSLPTKSTMSAINNNGNSSSSAHHDADPVSTHPDDEELTHPDDEELERIFLTNIRSQVADVRRHYVSSAGRILKVRLEALQSLADERLADLDEWEPPQDTENAAAYASARAFITSFRRILARVWTAYRTNECRIPVGMIRQMECLVEARTAAI